MIGKRPSRGKRMMHELISNWKRNFIYKGYCFFQNVIISKINYHLMKKNIFLKILINIIFLKRSLHSLVGFLERGDQVVKVLAFKLYDNKPFEISSKSINLSNLFGCVISDFKPFSGLMHDQTCLQQQSERLTNGASRGAEANTYFFLSESLVWLKSTINNIFPKISENIIGNCCRKFG